MAAYVPAIIWIISAIMCNYIARARKVKISFMRGLIVLFLGPLAIPLALLTKPDKLTEE
jgi:hypothetical protein